VRDKNEVPKLDAGVVDAFVLDELTNAPIIQVKAIVRGQEAGNRTAGMPSQLFLKLPLDVAPRLVADVDLDFDAALKRLDVQLKELLRTGVSKAHIKIAADGELRQLHLMKVYDAARKAGFENVHFVAPPKLAN
jgi:biopolymer transport protein ExbD